MSSLFSAGLAWWISNSEARLTGYTAVPAMMRSLPRVATAVAMSLGLVRRQIKIYSFLNVSYFNSLNFSKNI
jgi:hypothetical protein